MPYLQKLRTVPVSALKAAAGAVALIAVLQVSAGVSAAQSEFPPAPAPLSEHLTLAYAPQPGSEPDPAAAQGTPGAAAQSQRQTLPAKGSAKDLPSRPPFDPNSYNGNPDYNDELGSAYIPMDSWIYPALLRLYSLGYVDRAVLSLRPWTRRSVLHMLEYSQDDILYDGNEEAEEILAKVQDALRDETPANADVARGLVYGAEQSYLGMRQVSGPILRDSYHLGQSFVNDYGRPVSSGFNTYDGAAGLAEAGRFTLYVRGEYQHAPVYHGYSTPLASAISYADYIPYTGYNVPQDTIPAGDIGPANNFRLLEAYVSGHVLGHEISLGKSDAWLGPGRGGAMAWSNNAEDIYSFRINRVEPLHIPAFSRIFGDVRYDFFYGSLKGHTAPNDPWVHSEILSLSPTKDFQVSFQRTIIFGGKGHEPVTLHTFLKGFFSISDTKASEKFSRNDPGARFSSVTFSYRLPFLRHWATLYADSETHDDVLPISAPRRAGWRPGIYLSHLPGAPKLDFRAEATYTDYVTSRSFGGYGNYFEIIQLQGYTNKGNIMGDWIGREAKGGQVWLTYHMSGNEWVDFEYLRKKNAKDFWGTTQDQYRVELVKRLRPEVELDAWIQRENWRSPVLANDVRQNDTSGAFQIRWYPVLKTTHDLR